MPCNERTIDGKSLALHLTAVPEQGDLEIRIALFRSADLEVEVVRIQIVTRRELNRT
jgi:hypothetical protein